MIPPRRDNIYYRNAIGPKIRELRKSRKWTQEMLAGRLQMQGWDISRTGLAKIESGLIWIAEWQVLFFLEVFHVEYRELFPPMRPDRIYDQVQQWLSKDSRCYGHASGVKPGSQRSGAGSQGRNAVE